MLTIRPATLDDVRALAPRMRPEDAAECWAIAEQTPLQALMEGVRTSVESYSVLHADEVIAIYGVGSCLFRGVGIVWMLGSDGIKRHSRDFLRQTRDQVRDLLTRWDVLTNIVDERNTIHIRWLAWAGFSFTRRHPDMGHENRPFIEFTQYSKDSSLCVAQPQSPSQPSLSQP